MKIIFSILLTILANNGLFAAQCVYLPTASKDNPNPEFSLQGKCGELSNEDTFKIDDEHLTKLDYSKNGLASVISLASEKYRISVFYINKQGKGVRALFYDNGADYFVEGLARTISNNKYGFIDKHLNVMIKAEYDFASPFKNGIAAVCNHCKFNEDGKLTGGKWGAIDKKGNILIPIKYDKETLRSNPVYKRIKNL